MVRSTGSCRLSGQHRSTRTGWRALTVGQIRDWLAVLDASDYAKAKDLPDLVRFMLGTGCRLGEALGARWEAVDLANGTLHIARTVVFVPGQGLITKRPKTRSGVRLLRLPGWLVDLLTERATATFGPAYGPIFPDTRGGYRDPSNVEKAHRKIREGTRFEWLVTHTYRKTVATLMDGGGLSARTIADQLGHARISMTQDVYLGRRAVEPSAPAALEGLLEDADDGENDDDDPDGLGLAG